MYDLMNLKEYLHKMMPSIITQNIQVKQKLSTLIEILISNNAIFDNNLEIHYDNNGLSIHCANDALCVKKRITIPTTIMPCINDYEFGIKDNKLTCKTKSSANAIHDKIMFLMIDIFNLTDKISTQKNSNIFYNLKNHRNFLSLLVSPIKNKEIDYYLNLLDKGKLKTLILQTFINTRKFNLQDKGTFQPVILPFLDYFNHKVTTKGFQYIKNKKSIYVETSIANKRETQQYVSYNYFDALETLIYYGFTDTSTPLLFSIPMTIVLNNTFILEIKNTNFRILKNEKISKNLLLIKEIIPNIKKDDNKITISKLVIPSVQLPYALRKILHLVLNEIAIETSQEIRLSMIKAIEKQLIENNLTYFVNLKAKLNEIMQYDDISTYIKEQLHTLVQHNIRHLKNYGYWF